MIKTMTAFGAIAVCLSACSASFPPPNQRMADAQSAQRSAQELGASSVPAAELSLKLAEEQIAQAKTAMSDGDNRRADGLLLRAKADAELALAQARERGAKQAGQRAAADSATQTNTNTIQGAVK